MIVIPFRFNQMAWRHTMKTQTLVITTLAVVVGLGALSIGGAYAHGPGGQEQSSMGMGMRMMDQGYARMHQGYAMMHQGQGHGRNMMDGDVNFGDCSKGQGQALETPLTLDDVRSNLEKRLERHDNGRLKVGSVTEQNDKTIIAEIVTVDDSLVRRIAIDKTTGRHTPVK